MTEYGLRCSDILYKNSQFTLKLDFAVKKGELVSIIGPTGCGKSTLLSLISGLIKPESGSIEINGKAVNNLKSEDRHVGLVVQGAALFPNMDVEQNISYPMKSKKLTKDALKAEIRRLVELVNLTGNEKRRVNELSDSDKQKVALARALASEPELLLLEQVLSSLESQISQNLRTEIRDIQKKTGITMLFLTDDQEEALSISDRVMVLNNGRIEQFGNPEDIYRHPATEFVAKFTGQCNLLPYDVILKTLRVPETERSKVIYQCFGPEHRLFFRPEDMVVNDMPGLPFPEFYPHLRFENAKVIRSEYHGKEYLVTIQYEDLIIKVYTVYKPASEFITAGIRINKIIEFNNGKITKH